MTPWLRVLAPRPAAKLRLVCLAHAGGGPAFFRDWSAAFPEWIELVGFLPPGRENRHSEPPMNSVRQLADGLVTALATLNDKPIALFGHSLGGLIAYEACRRIRPTALIISATRIPTATKPPIVLHELKDEDLRVELSRLDGTSKQVLANDDAFQLYLPAIRADLTAYGTYDDSEPPCLDVPILALGGQSDRRVGLTQLLAWQGRTSGRFAKRSFNGAHFYLAKHRDAVATAITGFIENASKPADMALWVVPLNLAPGRLQELSQTLDGDERARAARFVRPELCTRFIATRGQVRAILGQELGIAASGVQFRIGQFGKPAVDGVHFNVSHSGDLALLAICRTGEVGVDLEQIRPEVDIDGLAERFYSPAEREYLAQVTESDRRAAFFAVWAGKEAYCKARGLGLQLPTDAYSVVPQLSSPWPIDDPSLAADRPMVYPLNLAPGYAAAIAGPAARLDVFRSLDLELPT